MNVADVTENIYLEDPTRFANVVNNGLFGGCPVISPNLLEEVDTSSRTYGGTEKIRDIVKKLYDKKMVIAIIGIENQSNIHYAMPLKNMWYDLNSYEKQRLTITREHEEAKDLRGDEWLSKFSKEDKLIPVITLVVYYGSKSWDGPLTLHSMLKVSPRIQSFLPLCGDYHVNLLEVHKIQDWDNYSDDLKIVFGFIKYQDDKESLKTYIEKNKALFEETSRENCLAIEAITKIDVNKKYQIKEKGTVNMCKAWEDLKNDAKMEGRTEGLAEGRTAGITEGFTAGITESILTILSEWGAVSEDLRQKITAQSDLNILRKWLKLAAGAGSIEVFQNTI